MSGFQQSVNQSNPLAVAGDFASANPRVMVIAGEHQLVAGDSGLTVGRFAWISGDKVNNSGTAIVPDGFVHREQQGMITTYLAEGSNVIPAGFGVSLLKKADVFISPINAASIGHKVYAKYETGTNTVDTLGAPVGSSYCSTTGASISHYIETSYVGYTACDTNELLIASNW